jgi:Bacterial EndoU nuclease
MVLFIRNSKIAAIFAIALAFAAIFKFNNSVANAQEDNKFIPFFDNENNPVPVGFPAGENLDISPPAPKLNQFDRAVLRTCGTFGSRVSPNQFKRLLSYYPDVLEKLQKSTDGELYPGRKQRSAFIEDLTNIWFQRRGFEHIFCGEIYNDNDIGGLHFYGRYLQLQQDKIGGRLSNNDKMQEVVPGVIYTMGVIVKQGKRTITDVIKGYSYLSNAQEILLDVTRIYKLQNNLDGACIFEVKDAETGTIFPTVFVARNKAIITYYPDATPKGKKCDTSLALS